MKITVLLLTVLVAVALVGTAIAAPKGKTVEFPGGPMGKVVFDGTVHADKGLKCKDCHTDPFPMKKPGAEGSVKVKAPHKAGETCFKCHDGKTAFASENNCAKCHKKG